MRRVTYFAHDVADAAVHRRVRMLIRGGADVRIVGFRRTDDPVASVAGHPVIDLGRTHNRKLVHRSLAVLRHSVKGWQLRDAVSDADVLLARNLEMATIADASRIWSRSSAFLAYECLDIHAAMLGSGLSARLLRLWDRVILRRSSTLIVSSPSFLENYFNRLDTKLPDAVIAENKMVIDETTPRPRHLSRRCPPWRIGWFGNLRCEKSFHALMKLATQTPRVDIELRGRPILVIERLIAQHLPMPNMRFGGPYRQDQLAGLYDSCDLAWAIDFYQEGVNSDWLLANRLYEGGFHNVPMIALAGTEMAKWLSLRNTGLILDHIDNLGSVMCSLTASRYNALQTSAFNLPTGDLVWTVKECRKFVQRIAEW